MAKLGPSRFAKKGGAKGVKPSINVTPLVDVVLVLLIIFMVVLPAVQDSKSIEMVEVDTYDESEEDGQPPVPITVVMEDGQAVYSFGENDAPRETCIEGAKQLHEKDAEIAILLRVDAKVEHKVVRDLIRDLRDVEVENIAFAVAAKKDEWSDGEGEGVEGGEGESPEGGA